MVLAKADRADKATRLALSYNPEAVTKNILEPAIAYQPLPAIGAGGWHTRRIPRNARIGAHLGKIVKIAQRGERKN